MAGVTPTGLVIKTQAEILAEINAAQKAELGDDWDISETSPQGVMNGIVSVQLAEIWELLPAIPNNVFPDTAEGTYLDRSRELTGSKRLGASSSTTSVVCIGTNATVLPLGRQVRVTNGGALFQSTAAATIATLSAWAISTAYAVGDLRTNDSGKIYSCTVAGTSAGSGGPTGTGAAIADGTCTWRYVGAGTAAVAVPFESVDEGAIVANAGTLTTIETAVGGWSSAANPLDAVPGQEQETDAEFRQRSEELLATQGAGPVDAIRADLRNIEGTTSVSVLENDTDQDLTGSGGLPPNSIEAIVLGGDDQDILNALLAAKAAGIQTYGSTSGVAVDSEGNSHTLYFTRPTVVAAWISADVNIVEEDYPADGDDQIKEQLLAYGATLNNGDDIVRSKLFGRIYDVSGVDDVTAIRIGTVNPPVSEANLAIALRYVAVLDSARIAINTTPV